MSKRSSVSSTNRIMSMRFVPFMFPFGNPHRQGGARVCGAGVFALARLSEPCWLVVAAAVMFSCAPRPESGGVAAGPGAPAAGSAESDSTTALTPGITVDPAMVLGPPAAPIEPLMQSSTEAPASATLPAPSGPAALGDAPKSAPPGAIPTEADHRSDGRPTWWIDEPFRERGAVTVAAEALAPDLRGARRAAVDAGLVRLAHALGAEPADYVVKATVVRPLRAVRGAESVNRFVGYVLIGAPER